MQSIEVLDIIIHIRSFKAFNKGDKILLKTIAKFAAISDSYNYVGEIRLLSIPVPQLEHTGNFRLMNGVIGEVCLTLSYLISLIFMYFSAFTQ